MTYNPQRGYSRVMLGCILIRSIIFQILLYGFIGVALLLFWPVIWISRPFLFRFFTTCTRFGVFLMRWIVNIRCQFENPEIFDEMRQKYGNFLIASKHQSGFETVVFSLLLPDFNIVYKKELQRVPLLGSYMKHMQFIPVDRGGGKRAIRSLLEESQKPENAARPLLIFPEGSRARVGERGRYHSGVALLYQHLNIPIVPVAHNAGAMWPKHSFMKYPGTITIRILPPILPGLETSEVLKILEDRIETACAEINKAAEF